MLYFGKVCLLEKEDLYFLLRVWFVFNKNKRFVNCFICFFCVYLEGWIVIVMVVFKFVLLCNDIDGLVLGLLIEKR